MSTNISDELEANFDNFTRTWKHDLPNSIQVLEANRQIFIESYGRIATLNAWKNNLVSALLPNSDESILFFAECLNDALVSHVFASFGSWRSALTSLRSCIENCLFFLFYKDHLIELKLWDQTKHKLGFTEMHNYLEHHPSFISIKDKNITGLPGLKEEYSTLSRAVHASAKSFRMSADMQNTSLWKPNSAELGKWATRERAVFKNLNLVLLCIFREHLQGTNQSALRKIIGHTLKNISTSKIKTDLGIVIPI